MQQQVTVTADVPVVNTSTVSTAGLVQEQQIKDLPLNGRSFDNLITLNAGAANVTTEKTAGAGAQLGNLFSISGRQYFQNIFLINGVDYPGPNQRTQRSRRTSAGNCWALTRFENSTSSQTPTTRSTASDPADRSTL